jgi:hypothetical protein
MEEHKLQEAVQHMTDTLIKNGPCTYGNIQEFLKDIPVETRCKIHINRWLLPTVPSKQHLKVIQKPNVKDTMEKELKEVVNISNFEAVVTLTRQETKALDCLIRNDRDMKTSEITNALKMDRSHILKMMRQLKRKGLVKSHRNMNNEEFTHSIVCRGATETQESL